MIVFLFLLFIYFIFIYPIFYAKNSYTKYISDITKLPNLSYGTSYYEPRIKEYEDFSYKFYPSQKKISYMDFIYEK